MAAEEWCPFCVADWATCENSCCKTGGSFGEEFWNCADIAVTGSGFSPAPSPMTTTTTTAAMTTATTATTTQAGSSGAPSSECTARLGNVVGATDAKCATACKFVPD